MDLATSSGTVNGGSTIDVYLGNGSGTFGNPIVVTDPDGVASLAGGDINGDGWPDIAVALADGDVEIFPGLGNGQFGSPVLTHTGIPVLSGEVFQIAAADINGDGKLDILAPRISS
jgi:hypothetical protein